MQFLPIVQRELLVASRKRVTYLSRSLSAGVLLAFFPAVLGLEKARPGFGGSLLLQFLATIAFLECLLAGVRYTSDCLSEEKREGTLGLLFLTNLSGFDVVSGKILARSLGAVFNLIAAIPILWLTVLVGGVTGTQIISVSLALLAIIVFSLCTGAFVSSRGFSERSVLVQTLLSLLLICLVPVAISAAVLRFTSYLRTIGAAEVLGPHFFLFADWLIAMKFLSPFFLFTEALRGFSPMNNVRGAFGTILAMSAGLPGLFLLADPPCLRRTSKIH